MPTLNGVKLPVQYQPESTKGVLWSVRTFRRIVAVVGGVFFFAWLDVLRQGEGWDSLLYLAAGGLCAIEYRWYKRFDFKYIQGLNIALGALLLVLGVGQRIRGGEYLPYLYFFAGVVLLAATFGYAWLKQRYVYADERGIRLRRTFRERLFLDWTDMASVELTEETLTITCKNQPPETAHLAPVGLEKRAAFERTLQHFLQANSVDRIKDIADPNPLTGPRPAATDPEETG